MNNDLNNEQFLAKVIELYEIVHANDVILLLNLDGIVLYTSDKVEEITGMPPSQVIGKNYLDSLPLPEENIPKIINSIDNTIKTRNTHEFLSINLNRIAQILSTLYDKPISTKTINNIIRQQLYAKFEVYNLESLQDKLYNHGYHKNIPVSFLCNLFLDLNEI